MLSAAPSVYREHAPPPALADHLICLWSQEVGEAPYPQRVLPDACIDIVWIGDAAPIIVGPWTEPFTAILPGGALIVGVRFRPGEAPSLLDLHASELCNREVPLVDLWDRRANTLTERLNEAATVAEKLSALAGDLPLLPKASRRKDELVAFAVAWLARQEDGQIRTLAQRLELSERQLRRRMRERVGYGPKTLQRILRLQRVLALAGRAASPLSLARLAVAAGYADQAHMTREVRELTSMSPRQLLLEADTTLGMTDFFKTDRTSEA